MTKEENTYCNKDEKMLHLTIKSLLPLGAQGMENELYNCPETNKDFLQNKEPQCHGVRYLFNDEDHITGVHVDTQNGRYDPKESKTRMNAIVGCFSRSCGVR
eukprot:9215646-Ditylum_brightwellii.AAC.1